jgi:hypothetical protein
MEQELRSATGSLPIDSLQNYKLGFVKN